MRVRATKERTVQEDKAELASQQYCRWNSTVRWNAVKYNTVQYRVAGFAWALLSQEQMPKETDVMDVGMGVLYRVSIVDGTCGASKHTCLLLAGKDGPASGNACLGIENGKRAHHSTSQHSTSEQAGRQAAGR